VPADLMPVKRALLSVSDKSNLVDFGKFLASKGVELLSTGGTAAALRKEGLTVLDVSEITGHPECLDGRVKTLHPKVHGGILSRRDLADHEKQCQALGIGHIDLVCVNLYPFEATVAKGGSYEDCVENIDIGGPGMVRAAAKNHAAVAIVTNTAQYEQVMADMEANDGNTTMATRKKLAAMAYARTAEYDAAVSSYFAAQLGETTCGGSVTRAYTKQLDLKYGCNPHQGDAAIFSVGGGALPFSVVNGKPGYINLLDALNAFQLVMELKTKLSLPAAASFKHVSPAGAAVFVPLSDVEVEAYEVKGKELTDTAVAYVRARNADPLCSFGDFAALSEVVDEATATFLKTEVSDGLIAPGYTPEALAILSAKKGGNFIVLQGDPDYVSPDIEYREVGGAVFAQKRNKEAFGPEHCENVVTARKELPAEAVRDMVVASIACKYTQSNSVVYALNGQTVGVGAGQQSRVDCVKLAGRKVDTWYLRQHPEVLGLPFKPVTDADGNKTGPKKQDRINARVAYIDGDMTEMEKEAWMGKMASTPADLSRESKAEFMKSLKNVAISSDAFFPFRDSIDVASARGVEFVSQPGGSVQDAGLIEACDGYNMAMALSGLRQFHH
jgi:phosphoribosylaminoimidazolecarboxamide formyltransferase/IMP cyclohydrolase